MEPTASIKFLPVGSILDRYLAREFIKIFAVSLLCVTALYLIVDFFDRIDNFLKAGAALSASIRYFLYKIPVSISRVIGFAALFSALFTLGMLARNQEIIAMRSSGLSVHRISLPLLLLSLFICLLTFFWNEAIVPIFARQAQYIYKTEVKKNQPKSLIGTKDIWIRGQGSFVRVNYFDTRRDTLEGVQIFLLGGDFTLQGFIEVPSAKWDGRSWKAERATQWNFLPDGRMTRSKVDAVLPFSETPEDLRLLVRDPEEFTFFELQKQVAELKAKGIDATEYEVDLQVKLAVPFISPLMVLLAIPFALRYRLGAGMALSFGLAMIIAFSYWVVLALCVSLGYSEALPPWIAGWLANAIFGLVGIYLATGEE